jgi:hypothetical protein
MTRLRNKFALLPAAVRMYVRDFVDFDYLDQLNEEELEWLHKFAREFYDDRFLPDGENLHNRELRQSCHRISHARRRDAFNGVNYLEEMGEEENSQEDEAPE